MKRQVSLEEISDGRLYGINDMVKVGCNECQGCSACCQGMGGSIVLDPLDVFRLVTNLKMGFEALMAEAIELQVVDGVILPNLKMTGVLEQCFFLNPEGRCKIHAFRPGICRLFPLGRYYENHGFHYILQVNECKKAAKTKVKVRKWIDTPNLGQYEQFILDWHYFLEELENKIKAGADDGKIREWNLYVLQNFYQIPFEEEKDFFIQFQERLVKAESFIRGTES